MTVNVSAGSTGSMIEVQIIDDHIEEGDDIIEYYIDSISGPNVSDYVSRGSVDSAALTITDFEICGDNNLDAFNGEQCDDGGNLNGD